MRPSFNRDVKLREQLASSSDAVPALISEGFPQKTDRHIALLLYRARGSSSETRTRLARACTPKAYRTGRARRIGRPICGHRKDVDGLIRYLNDSDWRDRG